MSQLIKVLMDRDQITEEQAVAQVNEAKERVLEGEDPEEVLLEEFGLEPDYVEDLFP